MLVQRVTSDQFALLREVRLAALQDAPYAFGSTYAGNITRPDHEWEQMCSARSEGSDACGFFAYDVQGEAIGMVAGYRRMEEPGIVDLISMWVAPEARGTGAATALVEAVCLWAKAIPVERVLLEVTSGNDRALRFYKRLGFTEATNSVTTRHCDADDIQLERRL